MCKGTEAWYSRLGLFAIYHLIIWYFKGILILYVIKVMLFMCMLFVYLHIREFSLPILVYFQYNTLQRNSIFTTFFTCGISFYYL